MEGFGEIDNVGHDSHLTEADQTAPPPASRKAFLSAGQGVQDIPVHARRNLRKGEIVHGPALITQTDSTVLLLSGHTARVAVNGIVIITRDAGEKQ